MDSLVHLGPYKRVSCPACGKGGWYNAYSSVKDPITYPKQEQKPQEQQEQPLSEEEQEKKRIEDSKYEKSQ